MRDFKLRPIQKMGFDFLVDHPRAALYASMGSGKTSLTLTYLDALYRFLGETKPTLVLAPLRVARDTWPEETAKWRHLQGFEVVPIIGTAAERAAALRRDAPVYSINYDNLVWLRDQFKTSGRAWPFGTVVADEATRLKGFRLKQGGARAQALATYAHKDVHRFIQLTGTPAPNGLKDLWGQAWFLDGGKRLGRTYSAFMERWFQAVPGGDGYSQVRPLPNADEEIHAALSDLCLTLDARDWFDLDEPIVNILEVDLPRGARQKYKDMEKDMFLELADGQEVEAFSAATRSLKCLQLASGAIYTEGEQFAVVHDEKLDALESIVTEAAGMPVLVSYHFKSDRSRILKRFPAAVDLATREGMARFRAGKSAIGLAHPASLGHGIDGLQDVTNIIAFFSHWWDMEQHDQILERIGPMRQKQSGHERAVFVHYIVAKGTVDELVVQRRAGKRDVQTLLLEYMKQRK